MANAIVLALWAFGLGNLLVGYPGRWGSVAGWVLIAIVVVHLAETLYVLKRIRQSPEPFWPNLAKSFVFGYLHIRRYL